MHDILEYLTFALKGAINFRTGSYKVMVKSSFRKAHMKQPQMHFHGNIGSQGKYVLRLHSKSVSPLMPATYNNY